MNDAMLSGTRPGCDATSAIGLLVIQEGPPENAASFQGPVDAFGA